MLKSTKAALEPQNTYKNVHHNIDSAATLHMAKIWFTGLHIIPALAWGDLHFLRDQIRLTDSKGIEIKTAKWWSMGRHFSDATGYLTSSAVKSYTIYRGCPCKHIKKIENMSLGCIETLDTAAYINHIVVFTLLGKKGAGCFSLVCAFCSVCLGLYLCSVCFGLYVSLGVNGRLYSVAAAFPGHILYD